MELLSFCAIGIHHHPVEMTSSCPSSLVVCRSSSSKPFAVSEQSEYAPSTSEYTAGHSPACRPSVYSTSGRLYDGEQISALVTRPYHFEEEYCQYQPGVDCGAIKSEFFTLLLADINERLFG